MYSIKYLKDRIVFFYDFISEFLFKMTGTQFSATAILVYFYISKVIFPFSILYIVSTKSSIRSS